MSVLAAIRTIFLRAQLYGFSNIICSRFMGKTEMLPKAGTTLVCEMVIAMAMIQHGPDLTLSHPRFLTLFSKDSANRNSGTFFTFA